MDIDTLLSPPDVSAIVAWGLTVYHRYTGLAISYQREINTLYHRNQVITLKYPKHPCHQGDASLSVLSVGYLKQSFLIAPTSIQGVEQRSLCLSNGCDMFRFKYITVSSSIQSWLLILICFCCLIIRLHIRDNQVFSSSSPELELYLIFSISKVKIWSFSIYKPSFWQCFYPRGSSIRQYILFIIMTSKANHIIIEYNIASMSQLLTQWNIN